MRQIKSYIEWKAGVVWMIESTSDYENVSLNDTVYKQIYDNGKSTVWASRYFKLSQRKNKNG